MSQRDKQLAALKELNSSLGSAKPLPLQPGGGGPPPVILKTYPPQYLARIKTLGQCERG